MKNWEDFDKFVDLIEKYMPDVGESDNKAGQICTAVNKLIYKWFNDGDVYDNTYDLRGWCNDLSDYANWLWKYAWKEVGWILDDIEKCRDEGDYEDLLMRLAEETIVAEKLEEYAKIPKEGTIYNCRGRFELNYDDIYEDDNDDDGYWF